MMMLCDFVLNFWFLDLHLAGGGGIGYIIFSDIPRAKGDTFFFLAWRVIVYWHGIGEQQRTGCSFF
jgi:hypothetical protein